MTISTYSDLLATARDWIARPDVSDDVTATCVELFEGYAGRLLRDLRMEWTERLSTSDETLPLPDEFLEARALRHVDGDREPLRMEPPSILGARDPRAPAGRPKVYSISGAGITLWPAPDRTYQFDLGYFGGLCRLRPSPASRTSNWLLRKHPDAYLWGTCVELAQYVEDEAKMARFGPLREAALSAIQDNAMRARLGAGPLVARAG